MNQTITIVSGLPRSGTSLMMQMLEIGGMEVLTDNIRTADVDNPKGYYEFEKVKKITEDTSWLKDTHGKAFKMVSMLLMHLPLDEKYKIIFMNRNMEEILSSQRKMLRRLNRGAGSDDGNMNVLFEKHLRKVCNWLELQNSIDILYVSYNDLIKNPLKETDAVNKFLGFELDIQKMAKVIDRSLYRNRTDI